MTAPPFGCGCTFDPYDPPDLYDAPEPDDRETVGPCPACDDGAGPCTCKLDGDPSWHYRRTCERCGEIWYGLHCPHDGYQRRCPACGVRPTVIATEETP